MAVILIYRLIEIGPNYIIEKVVIYKSIEYKTVNVPKRRTK